MALHEWIPGAKPSGRSSGRKGRKGRKGSMFRDLEKWWTDQQAASAQRMKERNDRMIKRDKARKQIKAEQARRRREKERMTKERMAAAAKRDEVRKQAPQVVRVRTPKPVAPAAKPSAKAPAKTAPANQVARQQPGTGLCGAPTEDGTPCQRLATDGQSCGAPGHRARKAAGRPANAPAVKPDPATGCTRRLCQHRPQDHRFFELRESGYTGWINQDGYKVNEKGQRV